MAYTESTMMALGSTAPDFSLPQPGKDGEFGLTELKGKNGTCLIFMCNHCPYVVHVIETLVSLSNDFEGKGISFLGINANDVENYPEDSPEKMQEFSQKYGVSFPYLFDETQEVARSYDAACTPDIYLFDEDLKLYYRGRLDDSRPKNDNPTTGRDLKSAMESLLAGESTPEKQYPSAGCNIKWKKA